MYKLITRQFVIILLLISCSQQGYGQQTAQHTDKEYARQPLWIDMIKDTATNYFEAQKAFKLYFQKHELPEEEHDVIGERRERERYPSKRKQRKMQDENHMRIEVKKYKHWEEINLQYVQPDGTILGPAARLEIWKKNKTN